MATDPAVLQQRLDEAEGALHKLLTGQQAVTVSTEGDSVTYNRSSIAQLRAYIEDLKVQLGQTTTRQRAIGVRA